MKKLLSILTVCFLITGAIGFGGYAGNITPLPVIQYDKDLTFEILLDHKDLGILEKITSSKILELMLQEVSDIRFKEYQKELGLAGNDDTKKRYIESMVNIAKENPSIEKWSIISKEAKIGTKFNLLAQNEIIRIKKTLN